MGKEYKSASQLMREAEERRASAAMTAGAAQKSAEELEIEQARAETENIKKNINIFQTAIDTVVDTGYNIDKGVLKGIEGIVDFAIGISNAVPAGINYLCGGDLYKEVRDAIKYDATGKIFDFREDLTKMIYGRTMTEGSLYRQNEIGQMVAEVEQAVGQMLPSVIVSIATMGAAAPEAAASLGTTVQGLAKAASLATLGVSAAGTSTEAAYQDGANFGKGLAYGAVSGGIEVATEKMFGGVTSAIYGKGMLPHVVPTIANKGFVRVGRELLEEGVEEVVSELASPIAKTIYKGGAALDEYSTADYWKGVGKSFAMGAATSALYTGTVGYGIAKATGGAVGEEANIEGLLEDAEKLAQKRESVFYSYKYDRNTDAKIGEQIARRYQEISKILVKMDPAKRATAIDKFSLGKAMAEDGQIAADFAAKLGIRTPGQDSTGGVNAAPGENLGQYASPGVDATVAEAAASDMGLSVFHGELTGESRTNYRDFLKTARNLNRQTGGRFNFVLVNGSGVDGSQVKGAYVRQGDLVLINTDTLADSGKTADALYENWFGVTVEEAMHLANNTDRRLRMDAYNALAQLLSEDEELVSKVSRELVEDGYFTEEQVKKFMTEDSLTEEETQAAEVFFDELFARMARHELSTKRFFQRLARRDRSALERFLQALKQSIKASASGKGKTAQGLTKRAQAAERLFMEAMAEAGFKVTEDGKIIGVNDEEEKEKKEDISEEKKDTRYAKKAAKREEAPLTPEEAAREDTPFGHATRRMLERDGETGESRVETDAETADETPDEIGEDVRLNRYGQLWVYGHEDAQKAFDKSMNVLQSAINEETGKTEGEMAKVQFLRSDERKTVDELWLAMNNAQTETQRRQAAVELAQVLYKRARVEVVVDDENFHRAEDVVNYLKQYLHRMDLDSIKSEIQYREDGAAADILRLWSGKKGGSERFTPDQIAEEFTSQTGIVIESDHPADIVMELHERYRAARKELERQGKFALSEKFAADNTDIQNIADVLMEIMKTGGEITSPAELLDEVSEQKRRLDNREKWTENRLDEKEEYLQKKIKEVKAEARKSIQKAVDKNREQLAANYYASRAAYIAGGIRSWKSGEFQAAAEKSNSDILKGTLGKLSKIYYRGNLAVDPTKRVMRELHDWYITQEAKDFLGESFWNQDIAEDMESIASVKGRIDSENLKKLCDVLQYMKHAIENFHTVEINGKRVDAAPVAKAYREKAVKSGREIKKETWFGRIFRAYIVNYRDPESLARYFDNYVEGGFLTDMLHNLREGELKAEVIEDSMVSKIEEFSKTHKKYFDNLEKRTIRVGSTEIPAGEALDIYLLLKRKQAVIHLMKSGYRYTSGDGMTERESGFMVTDKDTTEQEMMERAETEAAAIFEQMTEADKDFVNLASKIFNEDCKKFKRETDLFMLGFSNVLDDFYIPIRISDKAIKADDGVYQDELDRVSNASFNKSITEGAKNKIVVENLQTVLLRHIRGISKYAGLARTISEFETLVNMNLSGNSGDIVSIATAYEKIWPDEGKLNGGAIKYLKDMISDVQKLSRDAGNTDLVTAMVEKARGRAAVAVLGLNLKILATQFSSLFAATSIIPPKYIIQALYTRAKHGEAGDYSDLARLRNKENVAIRAMTLDDKVGKIGEKAMFAIGKTDEFVVHTVWKACKLMVRDQVGASVSQKAVNTQAGQLLTRVIYETQQNAQSTERSRAMRSNSPLAKIVTMFSADAMKVFGRVMDGVGELRARMARHESPARIAESKRKLGRSVSAMVSSAVYYAIISMLFRKFLARDDDDNLKEWSEADILEFLGDMAGSMMGGLPIIKEIYEFLMSGFSPEDMGLGALTDMMEGVKSLGLVVGQGFTGQATDEEWFSAIRKLMYAGGTVCGIPIANTIKYTRGLVNLFSDDTVYRYDALHAVPAYSSDIAKAVENGDEEMVRTVVGVMLDKNVGAVTSSPVRRELARLASAGQTVIPQAVGTSITYDGEAYQMNQRERKAFSSVYGQASAEAAQMISMASYQAMDDKVKAKALKRLYQFYYNMAMEEVLGVDIEGRAQLVSKVIDPLKLALIVAEAGELAADIGSDGKPVAGSKKMKVAQYIAKLKLTEAQKFIVYAYLGYTVSGGEQTIRAYVMAQKNLERGEKEEILEMCGVYY